MGIHLLSASHKPPMSATLVAAGTTGPFWAPAPTNVCPVAGRHTTAGGRTPYPDARQFAMVHEISGHATPGRRALRTSQDSTVSHNR
jgi:hypothetical protein